MRIGGVQKSLVNLLNCIHDKYEVTLLLFNLTGKYLKDIPADVEVLSVKSHYKYLGTSDKDVRSNIVSLSVRSLYAAISRVFGRKYAIGLMNISQKKLSGYDIAISYLQNAKSKSFYGGCNDFVLNCVNAPQKAAFLHCDYIRCGADTTENARQYAKFDVIAACSDGCREIFNQALPDLADKTMTVRNCHDFQSIRTLAEDASVSLGGEYINIVTVARLSREKGVLRAVEAIAELGEEKEKIRYYIIGDGTQREDIEQRIRRLNLSHIITLCGELENPYGYMKAADFLLIPSFEEAAPMVIDEAASLGTPVLSTLTCSAEDMVVKKEFGWVCENSFVGIVENLKKLVECPDAISERRRNLIKKVFNNDEAVTQFDDLIR